MVFHGRPSRDCAPCRKRKTRVRTLAPLKRHCFCSDSDDMILTRSVQCDLVPTGCSQCRRAKVTCHGYRTSDELIFRDETRNTMQKVLATQRASRLTSAPKWSSDVSSREAFLSLYAGTYSHACDQLQSLLAVSGRNEHLQLSVDAASLAFMAFQLNRQDLIPLASQRYLAAIRGLGNVMRSSMQAASNASSQSLGDVILQPILLLDLYEKMASQHHQSSESSGLLLSHVRGAASILQSLPRGEFSNLTIQRLAVQSVTAFTMSCAAAEIPIPGALMGLYNDLSIYMQTGFWPPIGLLIDLVNIRAEIGLGKPQLSGVVKHARDLYDEVSRAESNIPCSHRPQRIDTCEAIAFNGYYDVYPGQNAARCFNAYRLMRLDVADIIQKLELDAGVAQDITQVTLAICASIPSIILLGARPQNALPFSPIQILECSSMLTPLYAAARYTQDSAMRAWILQILIYMANNGVKMAKTVACILLFKPQVSFWSVFKIVGSYAVFCP